MKMIEQMQIRSADGATRDFDDRVASVLDFWIGNGVASNVCLPCQQSAFMSVTFSEWP